ncbi:FIST signal transduction protein [Clostridium coskatii]|uniref:FIST N domain protein n=1 Tax=Clostridium coskatii TaxID=1705578 RepID=A0A166UQ09_9CLOT|nr:FIST N-terminal domain-containing protein [Clostridium coskatii]OAA95120.1 FIST N domain protein [Clostridium coskatii]OBR97532.1 FIST N domain protein [Clostridium coskatii]
MAGKIKEIIDNVIKHRSKGNPAIAEMTKTKFILKGINPNKFDSNSYDDPIIIEKLIKIVEQMDVKNSVYKGINIKSVFSTKSLEKEVVEDIKNKLAPCNAKLIIFFASSKFDQYKLSNLMKEAFKDCLVAGCSTSGEIVSGKLLKNSVVAMAFNSNIVSDAKVEVIENMKQGLDVERAFTSLEKYFNESAYTMNTKKFVGIVLIDGVSKKEENIMDLIGNRTNVFFIGGSAGDDYNFRKTYILANGKAYTDSAVIIMPKISDNAEFSIIKTESFKCLDTVLTANKVDESNREVIEFNNKPAIVAYSNAVGAHSIEDVQNYFTINPVGLVIGKNDVFVRSPQQVKGTSMLFYCNILEGTEVRLLQSTNIIEDTKKAIESKINEFGKIDGIINFNCVQRTRELEEKGLEKQYGDIFKDMPTIGFSCYGEEFIGHMNQTATMLVFKSKTNI